MSTKKKVIHLDAALHIGARPEAIREARLAIMDILNCGAAGDEPKVAALQTLGTLCSVNNTVVKDCDFRVVADNV